MIAAANQLGEHSRAEVGQGAERSNGEQGRRVRRSRRILLSGGGPSTSSGAQEASPTGRPVDSRVLYPS